MASVESEKLRRSLENGGKFVDRMGQALGRPPRVKIIPLPDGGFSIYPMTLDDIEDKEAQDAFLGYFANRKKTSKRG